MSGGFLALGGFALGPLAVTHGLGPVLPIVPPAPPGGPVSTGFIPTLLLSTPNTQASSSVSVHSRFVQEGGSTGVAAAIAATTLAHGLSVRFKGEPAIKEETGPTISTKTEVRVPAVVATSTATPEPDDAPKPTLKPHSSGPKAKVRSRKKRSSQE